MDAKTVDARTHEFDVQDIEYLRHGDKPLLAKVYKPRGEGPFPALVDLHGGAWCLADRNTDKVRHEVLAGHGVVVVSLDWRTAKEGAYPLALADINYAIRWVKLHAKELKTRADLVGISGQSSGGHLAMLAAYSSTGVPIRSVVSFYGPTDLTAMHADPPKPDPLRVPAKLEDLIGTTPTQSPAAYRDASPVHYLRRGLPPTLQIQGARDHIVKPRFPREFHEQLLANGVRSLLLELPWSDHSFDFIYFGPGNTVALAYIDAFLGATLR